MAEVAAAMPAAGAPGSVDGASLLRLSVAPHRLLFFIGASNLLLAMCWWALWLTAQRWHWLAMPQPAMFAGWLHAWVMQYQMLPSFIFGFLLTVFPRWMGLPDLPRWRYAPVGLGLFGGQLATLLGAFGWPAGLLVGWLMTAAGWLAGLTSLLPMLWREQGSTWHARSCALALAIGLLGIACQGMFLLGASPLWTFASIKIGSFGLLVPIFLSVAHRMFPFFAASVVPGYSSWRPLPVLLGLYALCLAHLLLELAHGYAWLWVADLPLLALSAMLCWRWWPRGPKPALLRVLFLALLWLPAALALYSAQSLGYLASGEYALGRAPAHALFIGFFGSVLIAMVTRVTQGHSGQALALPAVARFAFIAIQVVAVLRIVAEVGPDPPFWQALAAWGWLLALAPWVLWLGRTYLRARVDGRPG
jgi:uncharacterized protein involved in response to NO